MIATTEHKFPVPHIGSSLQPVQFCIFVFRFDQGHSTFFCIFLIVGTPMVGLTGGLVKLAEMDSVGESGHEVAFDCNSDHNSLVGLLLVRALNVRAALREHDDSAGRGMLSAPSAQQQ